MPETIREQFPGSNGKGFDVLMNALGTLLQEPIQYYAKVNLGGFVTVVNTLGGVNVNVAHGFCDSHYSEYGYEHGFSITAGRHHLNGNQALAYARVRKPAGESDFTRAARQQEVVSGIRDAIVKGGFINDPVGLHQVDRRHGPDERAAQGAAGPGRGGQPYRARADLPGGHHPSARPGRLRRARLHPGPRHPRHPRPGGEPVPAERDAPAATVTRRPSPSARSAAAA